MPEAETDPLVRLAGAVADGEVVNWNRERESITRELRGQVRSLELLDRISDAHRSLHASSGSEASEREEVLAPGEHWGPLRIGERLGGGSYGDVYRAHDPTLQRDVALKLLIRGPDGAGEREDRFLAEARRLARVRHPNVVVIHGVVPSVTPLWSMFSTSTEETFRLAS